MLQLADDNTTVTNDSAIKRWTTRAFILNLSTAVAGFKSRLAESSQPTSNIALK